MSTKRCSNPTICQLFATDHPWRVWHRLARAEYTGFDQLADGFGADIKDLRGAIDSDCLISVAIRIERRDAVIIAQRVDPRLHPGIPCAGAIAEAIENSRDLSVGKTAGEISDDLDDLALGGTTMLAGSTLWYIQFGVFAALPVDSQFDTLIANDIGYDLFDQQPNQALLGSIISRRIGPGFRKALG